MRNIQDTCSTLQCCCRYMYPSLARPLAWGCQRFHSILKWRNKRCDVTCEWRAQVCLFCVFFQKLNSHVWKKIRPEDLVQIAKKLVSSRLTWAASNTGCREFLDLGNKSDRITFSTPGFDFSSAHWNCTDHCDVAEIEGKSVTDHQ